MATFGLRICAVLLVAALSAACDSSVAIAYLPPPSGAPVAGAGNVAVSVTASDRRTRFTDRISTRKSAPDAEAGKVVASNDVVELVRSAVVRELRREGFSLRTGGTVVLVELQSFYEDAGFSPGRTSIGEVAFTLRVRSASGAPLYSRFYSGTGRAESARPADAAAVTRDVLQRALTDAMKKVVDDKDLKQALLASARGDAA